MGSKLGSITFFFISHLIDTIFDKFFLFVYSTRNLKKDQICKSGPFINAYATFFPAVSIVDFVYIIDDDIDLLSEKVASLHIHFFCGDTCMVYIEILQTIAIESRSREQYAPFYFDSDIICQIIRIQIGSPAQT